MIVDVRRRRCWLYPRQHPGRTGETLTVVGVATCRNQSQTVTHKGMWPGRANTPEV